MEDKIVSHLKPSTSKPESRFLAKVLSIICPKICKRIQYNLQAAFPKESSDKRKQIFQQFCHHLICFFRETLLFDIYYKYVSRVTIKGEEHLANALAKKRGLIVLSPHMGSWEVAFPLVTHELYSNLAKVHCVRRSLKSKKLTSLFWSRFTSSGANVITAKGGAKSIIKALKANEIVLISTDQFANKKNGMKVPLLGKNLYTYDAVARIAVKYKVPIVFCYSIRERARKHQIVLTESFDPISANSLDEAIYANVKKHNELIETVVKQHPEQWFIWLSKRWERADL